MSVSKFANALRTHSRLRVLTATRVAFPATRNISSFVAFRTAVPKNVSLSVSRSFTTSQVARNEFEDEGAYRSNSEPSCTIFIANIPWSTTEEDLAQIFAEFGAVKSVRIHMNQEGRPRGIAHVDFENLDSAVAAVESSQQEAIHVGGRDLRLDFSDGQKGKAANPPNVKLYFQGCSGDESDIRTIFQQFSNSIVDIHLLKNPVSGYRTAAGFVEFRNVETATEALEALQGTPTADGIPLALSYARPRRNFKPFGEQQDSRQGPRQGGSFQGGRMRKSSPRWENGR